MKAVMNPRTPKDDKSPTYSLLKKRSTGGLAGDFFEKDEQASRLL